MQPNHAVLTLRCAHADIDGLSTTLWDRGTLGLQEIELPGGLYEIQAYFDAPFDANYLPGFVGWHEQPVAGETDWQAAWQPVAVGERLWLAPHWDLSGTPAGRVRVNVHPGQGSGTSYSEPTLLMLEAMEQIIQPSDRVADIGIGSGILTASAHALGARLLFGCDVDPVAAAEASQSLQSDGIAANVWCGSPRSLASANATLVLANINAIQLQGLALELTRILAPGGRLLIGGFTERNLPLMHAVFGPSQQHFNRGPWQALLYNDTIVFK